MLVAIENVDTVSSRYIFRDSAGNQYKPEDYLTAFSQFVKENPEHIEAIRILLDRPKDWGTDALSELKKKLAATRSTSPSRTSRWLTGNGTTRRS